MLLHYNKDKPIYIIGTGISAQELCYWIRDEADVVMVEHDHSVFDSGSQCIIGFQTLEYRVKSLTKLQDANLTWPSYIHPNAFVSDLSRIGKGVIVHPMCYIGHLAEINNYSVICPCSSIGHNVKIGINNIISPSSTIGGSTVTGNNVYFGQRSSVKDQVKICSDVFFTMNSIVTTDIVDTGTYYGNRKIQSTGV